MRTIRLNGELGKKYGRVHKLDVRTPAEALRAMFANFPGLQADIAASTDRGVGYKCVVDREEIGEDALAYPMSRSFSITPVVAGAGKVGKIILGVALIAISMVPGLQFTLPIAAGATLSSATVFWIGVGLTLGGVAQMLAPVPTGQDATKTENNTFDGPVNVTAQGAPVPVGYGRMVVGSAVISAGITVQSQPDITAGTDYWMGNFWGGY